MQLSIFSLCVLLICQCVQSLHVYMKSGEVRCFYEDLKVGNLIIGDLDVQVDKNGVFEEDLSAGVAITIDELFDNNHRVLNQKTSHSGDFTFTALDSGNHMICIRPEYHDPKVTLRVFIDFDVTNGRVLDSKNKENVDVLMNRISQLFERLNSVRAQQDNIRQKESEFRDQSESANRKIVFWSIVQIIVLGTVCVFQLRYLKNFFIKQKVV